MKSEVVTLHNQNEIGFFLRKNPYLYLYPLGDLDDFFFPYTIWYALLEGDSIQAIAMVYSGESPPVLIALTDQVDPMNRLLRSIENLLPNQFYSHLTTGLEDIFSKYDIQYHGLHYRMVLEDHSIILNFKCSGVMRLSELDLDSIQWLYAVSYPDNWFNPRMLQTNQYFGIMKNGELVSIAGVHVFSPKYQVAALGNITTHPSWRNQGLGRLVTARLCQSLFDSVVLIGLNVKAENHAAISCYKQLGFKIVARYTENLITRSPNFHQPLQSMNP
jgi:ribosomal protein S18 acetylase RimI-like enzyme